MQQLQFEVEKKFPTIFSDLVHPVLVEDDGKQIRHWSSNGYDLVRLEAWYSMNTTAKMTTRVLINKDKGALRDYTHGGGREGISEDDYIGKIVPGDIKIVSTQT